MMPDALPLRLVVSPGAGRLRLLPPRLFREGREVVEPGQALAVVELGADSIVLRAPIAGWVNVVLGMDGGTVWPGEPVMAIEPETV